MIVGNQYHHTSIFIKVEQYSITDIAFFIKDPGLYTVEVVLESLLTPDIHTLPRSPQLEYRGFILHGFPLILNVTSSRTLCNSIISCNRTICTSKDIEADVSSSSGRWLFLGHTNKIRNKVIVDTESMNDPSLQQYIQGSNRFSIETDFIVCFPFSFRPFHHLIPVVEI